MQRIVDNQGNQLLRKLVRPVIVGAVGDVGREMVGVHIRLHQHIRSRLAGRIGAVRRVRRGFIEIAAVIVERPVHLVGGHMQKALVLLKAAVGKLPGRLRAV